MELVQCKVLKGRYGPQVIHEGEYYKIGSFSVDRVKMGKEYNFILETTEHAGRTNRWANLPRKAEGDESAEEELTPKKTSKKLKSVPAEPKERKAAAPSRSPVEWKVMERIADALEGIESLLERMVDGDEEGD